MHTLTYSCEDGLEHTIWFEPEVWPRPDRIEKLADFLYDLTSERFKISDWVASWRVEDDGRTCGTVCCAIGWCPEVFPEDWEWRGGIPYPSLRSEDVCRSVRENIRTFFGVDLGNAVLGWGYPEREAVSSRKVARRLRKIAAATRWYLAIPQAAIHPRTRLVYQP